MVYSSANSGYSEAAVISPNKFQATMTTTATNYLSVLLVDSLVWTKTKTVRELERVFTGFPVVRLLPTPFDYGTPRLS